MSDLQRHTERWRTHQATRNPLALGDFCDECGTRLQKREGKTTPCPMGPHEDGAA